MRLLSSPVRRVLAAGAATLLLTACGGGDGAGAIVPDTGADVAVVGQDNLQWHETAFEAQAGEISVSLTCEGGVNHNFVIDETGEEVVECARGETQQNTVELEQGQYTFVCTIPGHERSMRGSLTVE